MYDFRVLIVDDEDSVLAICKIALSRMGMEVETAMTANEAMAKLQQNQYDLALIDWILPDGNGIDLFQQMCALVPDLVGILVTGQLLPETSKEAFDSGFWGFLPKPFAISELQSTIARAANYLSVIKDRQRLGLMVNLSELAMQFSLSLDLNEVLQKIVNIARTQTQADRVSLMVVEQTSQGRYLRLVATSGLPSDLLTMEVPLGEGIAGRVALTGEPLLINTQTVHQLSGAPLRYKGLGSALCLPLKVANKVVGVLNLTKLNGDRPFTQDDIRIYLILSTQAALAIENAKLYQHRRDGHLGALASFTRYSEKRSPYRDGYAEKVCIHAQKLAEATGLSKQESENLRVAGLIHDLGLLQVPEEVLNKPDSLTEKDWQIIHQHPIWSLQLVDKQAILDESVAEAVLHHHERYDGTGYPQGLKGEQIPLSARILAIADTYTALLGQRPYRPAYSPEQACSEILRLAGSQLDPKLTQLFVSKAIPKA